MAQITIGAETELPGAWQYEVTVTQNDAPPRSLTARLAWPDYNHWTGGSTPPARLIELIAHFLVDNTPPEDLPASFDAAAVSRRHPALADYLQDNLKQ